MSYVHRSFSYVNQHVRSILDYFTMPSSTRPTLPERLVGLTYVPSWLLGSLIVSFLPYALFLGMAFFFGNVESWFLRDFHWWYSLLFPIGTCYILLMQPLVKRLLRNTVETFYPLLPANERRNQLVIEAFRLTPQREWLAFAVGALVGWSLDQAWSPPNFWLNIYTIPGEGLMFGLFGWMTYFIIQATQCLAMLREQTHGLNIYRPGTLAPLTRWSVGVAMTLVGGMIISIVFVPPAEMFEPESIIIDGIILLVVALVLLRSGVSSAFLGQSRILRAFILFGIAILIGTLGYHRIEQWPLIDGLYMTVITMTTIGYGETAPLSEEGRIFTILLSLSTVAIGGYTISSMAAFLFEGDLQRMVQGRKLDREIAHLTHHVILCGAGRVGAQIAVELYRTHTPFLIVEQDTETLHELHRVLGMPYIRVMPCAMKPCAWRGLNGPKGWSQPYAMIKIMPLLY
ncbi:MAG: hypothetical protein HC837_17815 [Chloroflexaceae bacterium]|nr:hypothetical protein [Chloroflexaceae bacterium]